MKRFSLLFIGLLFSVPIGTAGALLITQSQQDPNYLVISVYEPVPERSFNDAVAEASEWVRLHRGTGKYKSVRLFGHNWGPEEALYMIAEPNDWASIPSGFDAILEAQPDLFDQPNGWQAHSDNILAEIPVN